MATMKGKPAAGKAAPAGTGATPPAGKKNVAAALARKPSRKAAKDMLVLELRQLRAMFSEIAERYVADTEGEIAAVIEESNVGGPSSVTPLLRLASITAVCVAFVFGAGWWALYGPAAQERRATARKLRTAGAAPAAAGPNAPPGRNARNMSMGIGKIVVELFSDAISFTVWR